MQKSLPFQFAEEIKEETRELRTSQIHKCRRYSASPHWLSPPCWLHDGKLSIVAVFALWIVGQWQYTLPLYNYFGHEFPRENYKLDHEWSWAVVGGRVEARWRNSRGKRGDFSADYCRIYSSEKTPLTRIGLSPSARKCVRFWPINFLIKLLCRANVEYFKSLLNCRRRLRGQLFCQLLRGTSANSVLL